MEGYKQTEVGFIPSDWVIAPISSIVVQGKKYGIVDGPFGSNLKTIHYRKTGIPIISSGYVTEGSFNADNYIYVDEVKFQQEKRSAVYPGEIVMAKIGARCGASAILPLDHKTGILSGNALKISVDENRHSTFYIWQVLWNLYAKGDLDKIKSVGAQPAVSMPELKKLVISLPPTKAEQTAIAKALSDADAWIQSLTQLIAKKHQIKQGAIQTLLNPYEKGKLKDGWGPKKLNDVGYFLKGSGVKKDEAKSGCLPCIRYGEIYTRHNDYIKEFYSYISEEVADSAKKLKKGDILFAGSGETKKEIGKCVAFIDDFVAYAGGDIVILRPEAMNSLFLGYYLNSSAISNQKAGMGQGDAVVHISSTSLGKIEMVVPSKYEEQQRIAYILLDMDKEITELENKLNKAKQIKQGMMQNLLTGRIRLI